MDVYLTCITALLAINTAIQIFYAKKIYDHEHRMTILETKHKIDHPESECGSSFEPSEHLKALEEMTQSPNEHSD